MSTGIKILKASYGTGSSKVDVTSEVSSHIKDGSLNLVVTTDSLGISDPAPGQLKTLDVSYSINNGRANTQTLKDNELLIVNAPPERAATGLQVVKAEYGYTGNFTDVTNAVQNYIKDGSIHLTVNPKSMGIPDPNPNKQKSLQLEYTLNGSENVQTYTDGQTVSINAPPAIDSADGRKTPVEHVQSSIGVLWRSLRTFISAFLYFLSWNGAIRFGEAQGDGRFYFFIGAIPYSSYFLLPIYVFFKRLFMDHDIPI
jgi:hypothetical protein